jgi:hypothetical protein
MPGSYGPDRRQRDEAARHVRVLVDVMARANPVVAVRHRQRGSLSPRPRTSSTAQQVSITNWELNGKYFFAG